MNTDGYEYMGYKFKNINVETGVPFLELIRMDSAIELGNILARLSDAIDRLDQR